MALRPAPVRADVGHVVPQLHSGVRLRPIAATPQSAVFPAATPIPATGRTVTFLGTGATTVLPQIYITDAAIVRPMTGTATATFAAVLSETSATPVTFHYATADSSATTAAGDYVAVPPTTLTIPPGATSAEMPITVNGSDRHGSDRAFLVDIGGVTGATIARGTGYGVIVNPLGPISVYVSDANVVQPATGTASMTFTVGLSALPAPDESVTVKVATADGTAKVADDDYVSVPPTTLTFDAAGGSQIGVPITIKADPTQEGNETFGLNLIETSSNAVIADPQGSGTIINAGPAVLPSLYVSDANVLEPVTGVAPVNFNLTLAPAATSPVTVMVETVDGSSRAGNGDYNAIAPTTLTFAPGETSKTVTAQMNGALSRDDNGSFALHVFRAAGAVIADGFGQADLITPVPAFTTQRLVQQIYADVLGRQADAVGLSYWVQQLSLGLGRQSLAADFVGSPEYRSEVVTAAYRSILHRDPDAGGLQYYTGLLASGGGDEELMVDLAGSTEYFQGPGGNSNPTAVTALYRDLLSRAPDPGGYQYFLGLLNSGMTANNMAGILVSSAEHAADLVSSDYLRYLHRTGDPDGSTFYAGRLQAGMREEDLIRIFIGSDEYYAFVRSH